MKIIGIAGEARSGKDETAKVFVSHGWTRAAFADSLKDEVCRHIGITRE